MREPKNREERRVYRETLDASYRQEMTEINEWANNVDDIYYNEHRGTWVLTYKSGLDDDEFDTKEELMGFLRSESNNDE